ncbi:expressed unknown protein [Seminavis robusta]|uniref:Uncharacterized protein n=1 Tax=Seminavis robusta TaxID=568900 RepID=A0A9N8D8S2_9STRA|nr:expressed unknown protein [Seminavis robusta]|eukprot:Sro38_g023730.1 n/a (476) ;mRNA; f:76068-77495
MMIATDHDVRRLRQNDERLTTLFMSFSYKSPLSGQYHDAQKRGLDCALKRNTVLQEVTITADDSFAEVSAAESMEMMTEYDDILRSMGRLPALKTLQFTSPPHGKGILPVRVLIPILEETTQLQTLVLHDLMLAGTQQDFDQLAQQVQRLWYLRCFTLDQVQVHVQVASTPASNKTFITSNTNSTTQDRASLDALLLSLSMLPSLRVLNLTAPKQHQAAVFSPSAFSAIFLSSSILSLNVQRWDWHDDQYLTSMAQLLQANKTLQALTLGPIPKMTPRVAKSLASALQDNSTLAHLEIILSHMISDDCAVPIAQALHSSHHSSGQSRGRPAGLQSFTLSGQRLGRVSKACQRAFTTMMEHNYSLHKILLFRKSVLQPTLQFYTRLNALGRQSLLRLTDGGETKTKKSDPEGTWMQALAHPLVTNDLNAIYYFLSSNPSLCVQAAAAPPPDKKRRPQPDAAISSSAPPKSKRQRRS